MDSVKLKIKVEQTVSTDPSNIVPVVKKKSSRYVRRPTPDYGRTCLPVPMFHNDFRVWQFLKTCIGKELSKITMPVVFNEPLSFLQRLTEYMEYAFLLERADACADDPVQRIELVAAFAVSALACNWERIGKPFNPLLGETYELERDNYRIVCEQVSHHPPVSAFYAQQTAEDRMGWVFHGSIYPKLKFWGKSVEICPKGTLTIELPRHGEAYTWSNINCCVHNVVVGNLWIEQYGTMEITNHKTGHRAVVNFKPAGWFNRELHRLDGFVYDQNKKKLRYLYGKWTEVFKSCSFESYEEFVKLNPKLKPQDSNGAASGGEDDDESDIPRDNTTFNLDIPPSNVLWRVEPRPENAHKYFQFTLFAMSLNEILPEINYAPTDSRLRPDIRKLEAGDLEGASTEKNRLEEKQRVSRKHRKKGKSEAAWSPFWFEQGTNPHTKSEDWIYNGKYWLKDYSACPDIF